MRQEEQTKPKKENSFELTKKMLDNLDELNTIVSDFKGMIIREMKKHNKRMKEAILLLRKNKLPDFNPYEEQMQYKANMDLLYTELEQTEKQRDESARMIANSIIKSSTIKGVGGRPAGSSNEDRNFVIKSMCDTLLWGATYEDEFGMVHSQYRHFDSRTNKDLSIWEIYYTVAEYFDLSPETIKDIRNKT